MFLFKDRQSNIFFVFLLVKSPDVTLGVIPIQKIFSHFKGIVKRNAHKPTKIAYIYDVHV